MHTFQINVLIAILDVFCMFRTSCVHHQEDHLLSIEHILPPARLLMEMREKHAIKNCMYRYLPDDEHMMFETCRKHQ